MTHEEFIKENLTVDGVKAVLVEQIDVLVAENERLRKGIQDYIDGDYERPGINHKVDQCPHGKFGWDACENCIDAHFAAVLNPSVPADKEQR